MIGNIIKILILSSQIINIKPFLISRSNFISALGTCYSNNIVESSNIVDSSNKYEISYYDGIDDGIYRLNDNDITQDTRKETELKIEKDNQTPLTINYYGAVTTESCLALTSMIKNMDIKSKELEIQYDYRIPIKIHIQSIGGELMPSFYVCDLIRNLDTPVHIYIDGYVASAAATIAVCGHKRYMTKHSSMLIHQLKSSSSGKFTELKDEMSNLNMFMMNLKDIFLTNTKIEEEELEKLLLSDIWLSSEKCLEYGLVDNIL
tara:strand:+ start:4748 stop:5533 length:786 start_codon:yes stop_codon:yes gene_type:complete